MGMLATVRQLEEAQLRALLQNPDTVLDFVQQRVAAAEELDLDKAWHGLHYLLTGDAWGDEEPLCFLLNGGEQIGTEEDHDVGYGPARGIMPGQVKEFAQALAAISEPEFRKRYDSEEMAELVVYPNGWAEEPAEMLDWLVGSFTALQRFVAAAADKNRALVIYL